MRTIIAGSRTIKDPDVVVDAVKASGFAITEVVCGCAEGVDTLGERWALARRLPVRYFPAEWAKYGRAAGPKRNRLMAENADALIAVWDGYSPGTRNMIDTAKRLGLQVHVVEV